MNCAMPFFAWRCVIAAVNVVLPWSTCPIVPTFTCGLFRSNFSLAMFRFVPRCGGSEGVGGGAHDRGRTGDLVLTKDVLYRLSYVSVTSRCREDAA